MNRFNLLKFDEEYITMLLQRPNELEEVAYLALECNLNAMLSIDGFGKEEKVPMYVLHLIGKKADISKFQELRRER